MSLDHVPQAARPAARRIIAAALGTPEPPFKKGDIVVIEGRCFTVADDPTTSSVVMVELFKDVVARTIKLDA